MTSRARWQFGVLAGIALLLAIVLALDLGDDSPAGTAPSPSNPAGRAAGAAASDAEQTDVRLELLQRDRDSLTQAARNPFRFEAKQPPPAPPRPRTAPDPEEIFNRAPAAPVGPAPPPPIPLRYIGFVAARDGVRTASFADGRGNVFQGREGDIIEGRYKVLQVGTDSVELAYLDGRGRQTIRLSGQ
jgi:hypothetical protein